MKISQSAALPSRTTTQFYISLALGHTCNTTAAMSKQQLFALRGKDAVNVADLRDTETEKRLGLMRRPCGRHTDVFKMHFNVI